MDFINFKKFKLSRIIELINKKTWIIFLSLTVLVFFFFRDLLNSYFEADEWFHFTQYLPLVNNPLNGFLKTLIKTIADTGPLSRGQHIVPIGEEFFFLNTYLFGVNFTPYALISLMFHSINSFLVFLFVKLALAENKNRSIGFLLALGAGIFFALSSVPIHAFTWAAFYGQNVLSVTFFLLSIIFFLQAFSTKRKAYLYFSLLFLFLDLLTKETAVTLFFVLPIIALIQHKIFSKKLLLKLFAFSLIVFVFIRFVLPNLYLGLDAFVNKWVDDYINTASRSVEDTQTIVSADLSIHENIIGEIAFRAVTFPIKMTSELFIPRPTVKSVIDVITPIIYPLPGNAEELARSQNRQFFVHGPGNDLIIYLIGFAIFALLIYLGKKLYREKKILQLKLIIIGFGIIIFGTMPLVLIVLSFPRWGYDTYFDSRHYYMPSVGAAIIFPFLLLALSNALSKIVRVVRINIPLNIMAISLFALWFVNNASVLNLSMENLVYNIGFPRKKIIDQLKKEIPVLSNKTVIYTQTDGLGAYGEQLPFQTSFPPILTIIYYDKNPLPRTFLDTFFFEGIPQGYKYIEGRGLGYFYSKRDLANALSKKDFSINDIFGFYYDSKKEKLTNITSKIRVEMKDYLEETELTSDWQLFEDASTGLSFSYPPNTAIVEEPEAVDDPKLLKILSLRSSHFLGQIRIINIAPTLDMSDIGVITSQRNFGNAISKKMSYDKFHFNEVFIVSQNNRPEYLIKLDDKLIAVGIEDYDWDADKILEKILGSVIIKK